MARTARKPKTLTASEIIEEMLSRLTNDKIEQLARHGLEEPTWNEPTG